MIAELDFSNKLDRIPPQAVDVEEALLGGILFDPNALDRVFDILRPEHFYHSAHQEIYRTALRLQSEGSPVDLMTVTTALNESKKLKAVGGQSKIVQLLDRCVSTASIDQYALLIREKWQRRQLIATANQLLLQAHDSEGKVSDSIDSAQQLLMGILQGQAKSLRSLDDVLLDRFSEIQALSEGKIDRQGVLSGIYDLDAITQGWQASELIIVAARPSMGKTAFLLHCAKSAASKNLPVVVFSLEMGSEQLADRMLSAESEIESGRLRSGRIAEREWDKMSEAIASLSGLPVYLDDNSSPSILQIQRSVREAAMRHDGKVGLVLIDYLQLMDGEKAHRGNRNQELSQLTRALKQLAREYKCPVICLSQLSRGVEERADKRPQMSDLRDSGAIEQDADVIVMLYRDEYYNPDTPDRGVVELNIVKHRNGALGSVKALFEGQYTRFKNLARRQA